MKPSLPVFSNSNGRLSKEWWYDLLDWRALGGHWKSFKMRPPVISRAWFFRLCTTILLWSCIVHITSFRDLWQPQMLRSCFDQLPPLTHHNLHSVARFASSSSPPPYKSNGYLLVSCNGGLNQMRAAICDMVAISRHINVTLVIPELDKKSFWQDPSDFGDIFDVEHFITMLSEQVQIVRELPDNLATKVKQGNYVGLPPRSWSDETYYTNQILPLVQQHEVVFFNKTDSRLANNGLPLEMQRLRCHVNYHALRFTPRIEELGRKLVQTLRRKGPFIVLHLRYEMDMLAFSGCTHGCTSEEAEDLTRMRYAYPWWKEKVISSDERRKAGLCPLTPEETTLVLRALGYARSTQIYIAAGEIYGSERRMAPLYEAFPNVVRKEMLLTKAELRPFLNRSSQMAALDYIVSLASDVFIPTHDGNMAKVVEGHRRYLGYRPTIRLDKGKLVDLLDLYESKVLNWDDFALAVRQTHENRMGQNVVKRRVIPGRPKEEDSFYSNPEECICDEPASSSSENPKQQVAL